MESLKGVLSGSVEVFEVKIPKLENKQRSPIWPYIYRWSIGNSASAPSRSEPFKGTPIKQAVIEQYDDPMRALQWRLSNVLQWGPYNEFSKTKTLQWALRSLSAISSEAYQFKSQTLSSRILHSNVARKDLKLLGLITKFFGRIRYIESV